MAGDTLDSTHSGKSFEGRIFSLKQQAKKQAQNFYTPTVKISLIAIIIGILTGVLIGIYTLLMDFLSGAFYGGNSIFEYYGIPAWTIILVPMLGGLAVGFIRKYFLKTHYGVESVIEASALHGGRLKAKYALGEAFLSVITIGTGGSAGKEAPGVLMGAGAGSVAAKVFNLRGKSLRVYLGCGAAAGISAAFNAPLAGIVFVVEVIFGELEAKTFIPIVLSSVFSTFVFQAFFGSDALSFPHYSLSQPLYEFWLFPVLGILAGIASVLFIKIFYFIREFFKNLKIPSIFKPAIGGIIVGLIGWYFPQILGLGYDVMLDAVANPLPIMLLLALIILKTLAFSFTIGSDGAGGSIVPSMFVGVMLGSAFGLVCDSLIPGLSVSQGAYAIAGMGAVFAGTSNATFTSIILLMEMTQDYGLILPFMVACVLSNAVARKANPETIFTEMIRRKGYTIRGGREIDVMESILVKDSMYPHPQTVFEDNSIEALSAIMQNSKHAGFPVLNRSGELTGLVTIKDMQEKMDIENEDQKIKDIMTTDVLVAYPFETLDTVLDRMVSRDVSRLPVVMKSNQKKMVGIITQKDIMNAYNKSVLTKVQTVGDDNEYSDEYEGADEKEDEKGNEVSESDSKDTKSS
ncbi:Voltage-gated ClC-type chloride channel ClcB [Methanimicrococcus hongohii]|uniref:Voltage-gated ClC-type chloride channel ClcB n=1 Tax=Methanimicrococcus hongohii TaxID=3028295 RepID=A0AA96V1D5_9EURY|nr:chloride channel protein [Methanimicrococcus sp. Hf6]WNY23520.1 Voltage-gated ClC-type chloride channel ClcB [Methanimicrococcus sp. Hf6]